MAFMAIYEGWRDLMDNKSDPRTRDWLLMSSPFPTIAISLTYAYCVKVGKIKKIMYKVNGGYLIYFFTERKTYFLK